MNISFQIKPLIASCLRVIPTKYFMSDSFRLLCMENYLDEAWENKKKIHKKDSLHIPRRYENAFIDLISSLYISNIKGALYFFSYVLVDYARVQANEVDYREILIHLKKAGITNKAYNELITVLKLISQTKIEKNSNTLQITEQGIFVSGQHYDSLNYVDTLFESANNSIVLIDGYIDTNTLSLFTKKKKGITVSILTKGASLEKLKVHIKAFNLQYGGLNVKTSEEFHDRFIIIDNSKFYTLGASIKDLGKKTFMFSAINEKWIKETIFAKYNECWNSENSTS